MFDGDKRAATRWLGVVAIGFVLLHLLVVGVARAINWDEAIHVSQVNPSVPAIFMEPHRTRGLSLLVAPIAVFDPPMIVMRAFLVFLGATGLFAAFLPWIRIVGMAAPIAAGAFAIHWVTIFYAVEVLPNLPSALLAVGATGWMAQIIAGRRIDRCWLVVGAAMFAAFAMIRPPDAIAVGVGVALASLLLGWRDAGRALVGPAIGGVVGLLPWFVEGWVRFGLGPYGTIRSAGDYSVEGERMNLLPVYLQGLEDQLRCVGDCLAESSSWQLPPTRTTTFLVVAGVLAALAFVARDSRRPLIVVPAAVLPLLLFYGFVSAAMNLRYLMPVFALALLLPATGGWWLWQWLSGRGALGWSVNVLAGVVLLLTAWWQVGAGVERLERPQTRERAAQLASVVEEHLEPGDPCVIVTRVNYPQLQYGTGCLGVVLARGREGEIQDPLGELGSYIDVAASAEQGYRVFAITNGAVSDESPVRAWAELPLDIEFDGDFQLYEHRAGDPLPPPPCPPDDGPERRLAEVLSDRC